jgi:FkbM family methyltransferase
MPDGSPIFLRRWAEHFSRGIILRRRLPDEFRNLPIYVSPEAGLRYWRWDLAKVDAMLCRMARELVTAGSVVWDVGANVGLFSFSAAALAGRSGWVLAVEPDLWLAQLLTRSARGIQKNGAEAAPVAVLPAAVSETNGISQLQIAERARAANHLIETDGSSQAGGSRNLQQTVTLTLDFLLEHFPPPTVLKIDAEGAELKALRGASKLLRVVRPVIWCEVAPENAFSVAELLRCEGYQIYAAALPPEKRTPLQRASWDTLAVPMQS